MSDGGQRSFAPCARGGLRLVATDLDGTLLDSHKQVSPRSRAAIARLAERHIPLIVATGRPLRWLPPVWQQLPVSPLCICMNGALIYDAFRHKILRRTLLQSAELTDIVQSIHRALPEACFAVERSGADTQSQGDGHLPGEFLIAENAEEVWYEQNAPRTTLAALSEEPAAKLLVRCTELSSVEMAEIVRPLVDPVAHVTYSIDSGLLEISHPLATKGKRWRTCWIAGTCRRRP